MTLIQDIIGSIREGAPALEVRVGVFWTAVVSRGCGLASTVMPEGHHQLNPPVGEAGRLAGRSAFELAYLAESKNTLEAAIGMAAINSLVAVDESRCVELNAADYLMEKGKDKRIALVGHFPFVPGLRKAAGTLWVVERKPLEGDLHEQSADVVIPQANVVAITGSAFVNGTIEHLLALARRDALVVVLGPTTPMTPVLFDHGVHVVSGTRVVDTPAALRCLSEAATFRQMRGVKLLTMTREGLP
jgi:uncharacterized protein (DUF4213/DUF364 family)